MKTVETDDHGNFDFGPLRIPYDFANFAFGIITASHYTLRIDDDDWFEVEIKDLPRKTESVTIDVSPVYPDCSGGHEFIVKMK